MPLRVLYVVLTYLAVPLLLLHLVWRGFSVPGYRRRIGERFGLRMARLPRTSIWVHAVSVGEVQAAAPLVRALLKRHPDVPLVITTMTPTGSERVRALFGDSVVHSYVPYDLAGAVRRFFDWARPMLAIIMETELWPNLYHECGQRRVPLVLAVHPSVPAKNLQELIAHIKAQQGKAQWASAGNGTPQHMTGELFRTTAKLDMIHVPYKGSAPAITDLIGGHVPMMFDTTIAIMPQIKAGKVRAIAVSGSQRSPR